MAFIVFEGLDNSGKSTVIQSLAKELEKREIEFVLTREPGGTTLGEKIREVVLHPYNSISPETEILLISASRRDHIEKVIIPSLEAGKWIICDRFWPSTSAFQGAGRGLPVKQVQWLNQFTVSKHINPDLWVLLDMPVAEKDRRSHVQGHSSDRFEIQSRSFHQRVRECYLDIAKEQKDSWFVLNALLSKEELRVQVIEELKRRKWLSC